LRKLGYVLQSARVLGALGYSVAVTQAGEGLSRRGTGEAQVVSGDVLRKLLVQMEKPVEVTKADLDNEDPGDTRVGRVRQRGARRAAKGQVEARDAQVRGRRVAPAMLTWYNDCVGPSLVAYAQLGDGRRLHIVDCAQSKCPSTVVTMHAVAW
jgi:hypothetical protein